MDQLTPVRARARRGRALGPGRLFKRGKQWCLDYRTAQGQRRIAAVSSDLRAAQRIRSELVHARDLERAGLGAEGGQDLELAGVVDSYLEDLRARVGERHHAIVASRLAKVVARLGSPRIRDLRVTDVSRMRSEYLGTGRSRRSANLLADSLGACLRWATSAGLIARNPIQHLQRLPEAGHQVKRRRALTDDEIERFLFAADQDDARCAPVHEIEGRVRVPQRILLQALLETGARWNELRSARWGDLDLAQRLLVLRPEVTKAKRQRTIPLRTDLAAELRALKGLHERVLRRLPTAAEHIFLSPDGLPWTQSTNNVSRMLRRVLTAAGIPRVDVQGRSLDLHALRHSCASRLARASVPLVHIQRLLGHADVRTTAAIYVHTEAEDLRVAMERVAGRQEPRMDSA